MSGPRAEMIICGFFLSHLWLELTGMYTMECLDPADCCIQLCYNLIVMMMMMMKMMSRNRKVFSGMGWGVF